MSNPNNIDPFENEFEDESEGESLLSTKDLSNSLELEDFDSSFSVPKFDTKSKKYDKSFIESEDLEDSTSTVEISKPGDTTGKAEVYINRRKDGDLESIEVVASNGERILIRFEIDEDMETPENPTDETEAPEQE
ncbi:MAG: hypothetical protein CVV25_01835 [Ignavibacteriae bacterium HGW-Ignavibacteriae-4]|jgi:hypothetical protein|nr:MAG: hypothetical protein CVV25_01835 [Ignavibacteriae bacterium HGW-Ignavibacteriae-4]